MPVDEAQLQVMYDFSVARHNELVTEMLKWETLVKQFRSIIPVETNIPLEAPDKGMKVMLKAPNPNKLNDLDLQKVRDIEYVTFKSVYDKLKNT